MAGGTAAQGANRGGPVRPPLLGHNLDDDASCGLQAQATSGERTRGWGRCRTTGGCSTPTLALLEGSAAIDAGKLPAARRRPAAPAAAGVRHQRLRGRAAASGRPGLRHVRIRLRASACERETPTGIERPRHAAAAHRHLAGP